MTFGRRIRRHYRQVVAASCGVAAIIVVLLSGGFVGTDRLLFDLSLAVQHRLGIDRRHGDTVVVVAIDQRTVDAPELRDIPRAFFGVAFAKMIDAVFAADAVAIGFDVLFAYDSTRFDPKLEEPFRAALHRHRERIVLGRSAQSVPVLPILLSVPDDGIGFLELPRDADGVNRRIPARLASAHGDLPTFAAQLVARTGRSMPDEVRLAPAWHLEEIRTYALVDVLRCADATPNGLRDAFAGKVVLVGTTLPEEDRRLAPSRFIAPPRSASHAGDRAGDCRLAPLPASDPNSATVPGVHVHAAAIEAVLTGRTLTEASTFVVAALAGLASVAGATTATVAMPVVTLMVLIGGAAAVMGASMVLLATASYWLPPSLTALAFLVAAGIGYVARYLIEERRRRWMQRVFGQYLSPRIVDELAQSEVSPVLGGERRDVTVMFADLSGFTALSGRVSPQALMESTNRYMTLITEEVERAGGYVDKFIGDAVMAVWGVPVEDAGHARHSVEAALSIVEKIAEARRSALARGDDGFWIKIGLNSGSAIVGNVGSPRRLAYTVVGETVNPAARFESLPSDYGCMIVIGESTASALDGVFAVCELDLVKVKGKSQPVRIYEAFRRSDGAISYTTAYSAALAAYRDRRFMAAVKTWSELKYPGIVDPKPILGGGGDVMTPDRIMARRAAAFHDDPPPGNWRGESVRESK